MFLDSPRLSRNARTLMADTENQILVSAASAMEITLKHRIGKLMEAAPFINDGVLEIGHLEYLPMPITLRHASMAGSLPFEHKDPFDRLLIAQSLIEKVPLLSNEKLFDAFGIERIW